ncbi:ankyrin repeat protein [Tupanvirus deep ocean]|uniref:Ankyrin repeat protein n=2 Tax=Tupanvirus TaxID=2094720 RepID=A0AC62A773_9VIRU|nr:ankyrin repeat protein [Tupanvirus deep ocean]QKU33626.1 ankyrin repeat protein [Tupanvirus deep ocean]
MENYKENDMIKQIFLQISKKHPVLKEKNILGIEDMTKIKEHISKIDFNQNLLDDLLQFYTATNDICFIMNLINLGANIHANKDNVLRIAVAFGHMDCVVLYSDLGISIKKNYHLIVDVAERGNVSLMKYYLSFMTLTKKTCTYINIALMSAIKRNFIDIFKLLVDFGANIHYSNDYPLVISTKTNNYEISKYLLENGARANAQSNLPLINAIINKNHDIVQLLVDYGAHTDKEEIIMYIKEYKLYKIAIILSIFITENECLDNNTTPI